MITDKPRIPIRSILLYGLWPSFIKLLFYRLKGYRIGRGVSIGFGSVIIGDRVEVGDNTSISFLTIIRAKHVRLGPYVRIGAMTFLDTPHIEIGEGTKINEQVFVGGLQYPDSRFIVGRNCQIMQMSFINPARSVVIGDDSGIGGHCLIFGHSSFQNVFEGYDVTFEPIEIGANVGLAWRVFVHPGTRIGHGSLVAANSVVSGVLPPNCLAAGFPARIVGKPPVFPKSVSDEEKIKTFREITAEMIQFLVGSGFECKKKEDVYEIQEPRSRWRWARQPWHLHVSDGDVRDALRNLNGARPHVFLSLWEIPGDIRDLFQARNIMWLDVAKKEQSRVSNALGDEVSNFLKRYGVRTLRYPSFEDAACGGLSWRAIKS